MKEGRPAKIAINHDDYHAEHIGKTADGNQFFLKTPFDPAINGNIGGEYLTLFIFDSDGNLIDSTIESFGPRGSFDEDQRTKRYQEMLDGLGEVEFCRIEVKLFSVEKYGLQFGLITRVPEDEEDVWAVELLPGNYMAFFEPWDSGEYDT